MRVNTAIGKFFISMAAIVLALVVVPTAPAFAADTEELSMGRGTSYVFRQGTMVKVASESDDEAVEPMDDEFGGNAGDLEGPDDVDPSLLDEEAIPVPYLLEPPAEDSGNPTVAEQEQSGPKTLDSSREAIQQAATHVATPTDSKKAEEATTTVGANLQQTGDSLMEGLVVAFGAVAIVAFSLLLYHFRKE